MTTPTQLSIRQQIRDLASAREQLAHAINHVAEAHIPDFHYLDYKVSDFWSCDDSPIGMCVWVLDEGRFHIDCVCRYCGDPVERK